VLSRWEVLFRWSLNAVVVDILMNWWLLLCCDLFWWYDTDCSCFDCMWTFLGMR
jgi:hypothetical protein